MRLGVLPVEILWKTFWIILKTLQLVPVENTKPCIHASILSCRMSRGHQIYTNSSRLYACFVPTLGAEFSTDPLISTGIHFLGFPSNLLHFRPVEIALTPLDPFGAAGMAFATIGGRGRMHRPTRDNEANLRMDMELGQARRCL